MNEPSRLGASVSGYMIADVDDLVPFSSITWEAVCVGCDSAIVAIPGALWSPREASGLSERMELKDITEGVLERFGEMVWSSPLQETMRFAMRWGDTRTRVQSDVFHPRCFCLFWFGGSERPYQVQGRVMAGFAEARLMTSNHIISLRTVLPLQLYTRCFFLYPGRHADPAVDVALPPMPVVDGRRGHGNWLCEFGERFMNSLVL